MNQSQDINLVIDEEDKILIQKMYEKDYEMLRSFIWIYRKNSKLNNALL